MEVMCLVNQGYNIPATAGFEPETFGLWDECLHPLNYSSEKTLEQLVKCSSFVLPPSVTCTKCNVYSCQNIVAHTAG